MIGVFRGLFTLLLMFLFIALAVATWSRRRKPMWPRHMPSRLRSNVRSVSRRLGAGAVPWKFTLRGNAASQGISHSVLPNPSAKKALCQPKE